MNENQPRHERVWRQWVGVDDSTNEREETRDRNERPQWDDQRWEICGFWVRYKNVADDVELNVVDDGDYLDEYEKDCVVVDDDSRCQEWDEAEQLDHVKIRSQHVQTQLVANGKPLVEGDHHDVTLKRWVDKNDDQRVDEDILDCTTHDP